jgi:hypothetical protein
MTRLEPKRHRDVKGVPFIVVAEAEAGCGKTASVV